MNENSSNSMLSKTALMLCITENNYNSKCLKNFACFMHKKCLYIQSWKRRKNSIYRHTSAMCISIFMKENVRLTVQLRKFIGICFGCRKGELLKTKTEKKRKEGSSSY